MTAEAGPRGRAAAAWGLVAMGVALRLHLFFVDLPMHGEEAARGLSILPGGAGTAAAAGGAEPFSRLVAAVCRWTGEGSQASLRLLPLLAGCLAAVLAVPLSLRLLPRWWALAGVAALALAADPILASATCSPESMSTAAALLLLLSATGDGGGVAPPRGAGGVAFALGAAAAVTVATAALPVLGGCVLAWGVAAWRRREVSALAPLAVALVPAALAVVPWPGALPPWHPAFLGPESMAHRAASWFGSGFRGPVLFVLLGGMVAVLRTRPLAVTAAALCLILLPGGDGRSGADGAGLAATLPVAVLGAALVETRWRTLTVALRAAGGAALLVPGLLGLVDLLPSGETRRVDVAALVPALRQAIRDGDRVVVLPAAADGWVFHHGPNRLAGRAVMILPTAADVPNVLPGLVEGRPEPRVWIVAVRSPRYSLDGTLLQHYAERGRTTVYDSAPGAVLMLWEHLP